MSALYKKNGLLFAIMWIVIYVVGLSVADNLSISLGIEKSITVPVCLVMTVIIYAIAGGFLFTVLFYKTKSLWACIITHSVLNALSVFANESVMTPTKEVLSAGVLTIISVAYAIYILKRVEIK